MRLARYQISYFDGGGGDISVTPYPRPRPARRARRVDATRVASRYFSAKCENLRITLRTSDGALARRDSRRLQQRAFGRAEGGGEGEIVKVMNRDVRTYEAKGKMRPAE